MITLPENFITNFQTVMSGVFTDLLPLILFIAGILIAIFIITSILDRNNDNRFNIK